MSEVVESEMVTSEDPSPEDADYRMFKAILAGSPEAEAMAKEKAPEVAEADLAELSVSEVPSSEAKDSARKEPGAVYGGPAADSPYKLRQAKILASKAPMADKGKALRAAKAEAAAKGDAWKPEVPVVETKETRDETEAPKDPGAVYGGQKGDAAFKLREARILASKAPGVDKGAALRAARVEASQKGLAWTPEVPNAEGIPIPLGNVNPENPGAVYGGPAADSPFMLRQAKILAAAKGEAWKPDVTMSEVEDPATVEAERHRDVEDDDWGDWPRRG